MTLDCLIIGGGPAGLVAATYLGRFKRRAIIWDAGESRAQWIPCTHNTPGFPNGVSGLDLLERLRSQAREYGAELRHECVQSIRRDGDCFEVESEGKAVRARKLILATGVKNAAPDIQGHEEATRAAIIRYCPICDGFESSGKRIAVLSGNDSGVREADFISAYCDDIVLYPLNADVAACWTEEAACHVGAPPSRIAVENGKVVIEAAGAREEYDVLYPALGVTPASRLAKDLGADLSPSGGIIVDAHMRTSVPGLYAIGDVVEGLDQIAVAYGHAAIAAVDVHNALRRRAKLHAD